MIATNSAEMCPVFTNFSGCYYMFLVLISDRLRQGASLERVGAWRSEDGGLSSHPDTLCGALIVQLS